MKAKQGQYSLITLGCMLLICGYFALPASASSFLVKPAITSIQQNTLPLTRQITLQNTSDQTEQIQTQIIPITQDKNGNPVLLENNQADKQTLNLLANTQVSPSTFSLLPQQSKQVEINISSQSGSLIQHNYNFTILFISHDIYSLPSSGKQVKATLLQEPAIASIFLLSPLPTTNNILKLNLKTSSPIFTNTIEPHMLISNSGPINADTSIHYTLTDIFGHVFLDQERSHVYLLSGLSRQLSLNPIKLPLTIIGPVKLTISIYDASSKSSVKSIQQLIILPLSFWGVCIIVLGITVLIIQRIRARLRHLRS